MVVFVKTNGWLINRDNRYNISAVLTPGRKEYQLPRNQNGIVTWFIFHIFVQVIVLNRVLKFIASKSPGLWVIISE